MSLKVPPALVDKAQQGPITDQDFIACIQESLPYAWSVMTEVHGELTDGVPYAVNETAPPDEASRGQLLRLVASDAMRGAVERHFGVRLAFQNCHGVGMFRPSAKEEREAFISPRAQVLNQRPEFVNC
ncbi:SCO5389 family protein [Actinokineospora sp. HUAS TT18]|uniref:SCO5389 family protein n=1 Tax=Actinokineospora sp. HUAS TT18 TaxID=3447451 RepID=UPI003F5288CA